MQNFVGFEINIVSVCLFLGIVCGIVFDMFKAARYGKVIKVWQLILQDSIYYCIISVIIFLSILKVNNAEIRGYMPIFAVLSFMLYRYLLSRYVVRCFVWLYRVINYLIKLIISPLVAVYRIINTPFLYIKRKLLSKIAKIALTFKEFCFKIKCNVGMLCVSKKIFKERKPCRRKQKPGKRV